ncbi:hypothetical protein lotta82_gp018 [Flavobacterium phage vB_FspM_lotta8-2]|uniref:Uncharacterized protein n=1 Tax=Flavobacterium phage vB_FspM_lotta8-2 TaxID=2686243 RepID=A0A6B9LLE1_9CAUD|nr:hypothetical protein lotta82_gp018 [Flavobacterium phage vB_FspM_lotta8-2]
MKIHFKHGEGSRISNKILKALRKNDAFIIEKTIKDLTSSENENNYITTISTKNQAENESLAFLRNEIIALIPELFSVNYFFTFTDTFSSVPFGFKAEFLIDAKAFGHWVCYTKIKEQKPKSEPINAYKIIVS